MHTCTLSSSSGSGLRLLHYFGGGVATLAAAAVLMGNTRRATQPQTKTVLMAFENERGVQDPVRRN
eukprot:5381901-Amphidinium_carterae.1